MHEAINAPTQQASGSVPGPLYDPPLSGIKVVDLVRGPLAPITRYLAELGARVHRVDPGPPVPDDVADLVSNLGKVRCRIDLNDQAVAEFLAAADIIVADARQPLNLSGIREKSPRVVTMTVSDFGTGTSFEGWQATGPVLHALSGELSRSGIRGRPPLLPPGDLAYQCAAAQAAYALLTSLYRALRTGAGDHIDFSALDGAVQALDPGYGISGSATMGKPAHALSRDRPAKGFQYPILRCADGHVRICLLAKRQWQGMFRWMGEPAQFASREYEKMAVRYKSPDLLPAISKFFAERTRAALESEGQKNGVPIAAVLTLDEFVSSDHSKARRALREVITPDGRSMHIPNGVVTVDGVRTADWVPDLDGPCPSFPAANEPRTLRAFDGLRVLDLGVIVVGAEQARLLADQGADVIKVESRDNPDGNRQSYLSFGLSVSFAAGHRNKRSLGINLRDPRGRDIFLDLAAKADVIFSNFKPGTLEKLGLSYESIATINPGIVMADSSAFGATGPWQSRMGYGPLVRAATGLTLSWRYPDDPEGFSDSTTIYPDHVAGRIGAMSAVALLIRRLRTRRGGWASVSQAEVMLNHFAAEVARRTYSDGDGEPPDWPWGVYKAVGEDEWCVVTVRHTQDWLALCTVLGLAEERELDSAASRLKAREHIDAVLVDWLSQRSPEAAMVELQRAGVPAAQMLRVADLPTFGYYQERGFYRTEAHPYLQEPVIAERSHAKSAALAEPADRPAPLMGQHSEEVLVDWLGLGTADIRDLIESGVIEPLNSEVLAQAHAHKTASSV